MLSHCGQSHATSANRAPRPRAVQDSGPHVVDLLRAGEERRRPRSIRHPVSIPSAFIISAVEVARVVEWPRHDGKATQDAGSGSASHTIKPDTPRPEPGPNGQFSVDAETCGAFCRERQDRSARKISFIRARIEVAFVSASRMICTRSGSGGLPTVAISFRKRALVVAYSSQSCLSSASSSGVRGERGSF